MRFDDVVNRIRCPGCRGTGSLADRSTCELCNASGINPEVIEEASGWDSWAMTVHDSPGWIIAVHLGLTDPTGNASTSDPWSSDKIGEPSL
jgi:hypothetical protein